MQIMRGERRRKGGVALTVACFMHTQLQRAAGLHETSATGNEPLKQQQAAHSSSLNQSELKTNAQ